MHLKKIVIAFGVITLLSSCGLFKKKCDTCPSFSQKEMQKNQEDFTEKPAEEKC